MNKQRRTNFIIIRNTIPNAIYFVGFTSLFLLFMMVSSCQRKKLSVLYRGNNLYEVIKDSNLMRIVSHKCTDNRFESDTTEVFFDKGEYIYHDGSLFMSTKRDTSYSLVQGKDNGKLIKNVKIRPERYEHNNNRFFTLILYCYSFQNAEDNNPNDSLSALDTYFACQSYTVIERTILYIYDKDYHLIEIQEMASFMPN